MHCDDTQRQLDLYLDGSLPNAEYAAITVHLTHCPSCRLKFEQAQRLHLALHAMPVTPPREGYAQRVLGFLREPTPTPRANIPLWFASGFATAMLLLIAAWLGFFQPRQQTSLETLSATTLHVLPDQIHKVDLVFYSPHSIHQATLRIDLPAGIELAGYHKQHILQWRTSLKPGNNQLALPLLATGASQGGTLTASLIHNGKTHSFRVKVITDNASSQRATLSHSV